MISFFCEQIVLKVDEETLSRWIDKVVVSEGKHVGDLSFIFCDDDYLLRINQKFLDHDTYTDVISFDNSIGNELGGDIFISAERVNENAKKYKVSEEEELRRVIIHGVLHFCGYKDKTEDDIGLMRKKENEKLAMFHVEHR